MGRTTQSTSSTATPWASRQTECWLHKILERSWTDIWRKDLRWAWHIIFIIFLLQLSRGGLVPGKRGYNVRPTESERMHCIAFVISAMGVSAMDPDIVKKFKDIRKEARDRGAAFFSCTALPLPNSTDFVSLMNYDQTKR